MSKILPAPWRSYLAFMASFIVTSAVWWGVFAVIGVSALSLITGVRGGRIQYGAERQAAHHDRRSDYLSRSLYRPYETIILAEPTAAIDAEP